MKSTEEDGPPLPPLRSLHCITPSYVFYIFHMCRIVICIPVPSVICEYNLYRSDDLNALNMLISPLVKCWIEARRGLCERYTILSTLSL